jgi:hypothetical protein
LAIPGKYRKETRIEWNPRCHIFSPVKTTIDIPDALYNKAKTRAIELGQTLEFVVIDSLARDLEGRPARAPKPRPSFWERRKLLPAYKAAIEAGALSGGTDSAAIISEDRSAREEAPL